MHELSVDPWWLVDASLSFTDMRLGDLVRYWRGKQADGRLPARHDIDPLELRALMGHLFVVDVAGDPSAWRYSLIGTTIAERAGADGTGKSIGEIFPADYAPAVLRAYQYAIGERTALRIHGCVRWQRREHLAYDAAIMPLAADGTDVDKLFGAMIID